MLLLLLIVLIIISHGIQQAFAKRCKGLMKNFFFEYPAISIYARQLLVTEALKHALTDSFGSADSTPVRSVRAAPVRSLRAAPSALITGRQVSWLRDHCSHRLPDCSVASDKNHPFTVTSSHRSHTCFPITRIRFFMATVPAPVGCHIRRNIIAH